MANKNLQIEASKSDRAFKIPHIIKLRSNTVTSYQENLGFARKKAKI